MKEKIIIFKTSKINATGRNYICAIPFSKIHKLETLMGSENAFLKINDIEAKEYTSFNDLIKLWNKIEL